MRVQQVGAYWCLAASIDNGWETLSLAMIRLELGLSHLVTARATSRHTSLFCPHPPNISIPSSLTPCPSLYFPFYPYSLLHDSPAPYFPGPITYQRLVTSQESHHRTCLYT